MLMGRDTLMGYLATLDFTMSRREQQAGGRAVPGRPADAAARRDAPVRRRRAGRRWRSSTRATRTGWRRAPTTSPSPPASATRSPRRPAIPSACSTSPATRRPWSASRRTRRHRPGQRIRFRTTTEGDGQVPWSTGIPPGIRAWYTDAVHGDLARHEPAFPAILDLLETGTTRRLPTTPPAAARGRGVPAPKVRDTVPMFPDAEDLLLAGHGRQHARRARGRPAAQDQDQGGARPSGVRQASGAWSATMPATRSTVPSGSSTWRWAAGWRKRKQLGLYPGALGTNTVVLDRQTQAARGDRRRPGRSRRPRARHAGRDPASRASGLRDRGRGRPLRARPVTEARQPLGCHRAAGRRRRSAVCRSPAASRRCCGRCWRPSGRSTRTGLRSSRCSSWSRTAPSGRGTCSHRPLQGSEFSRALRARSVGQGHAAAGAATSRRRRPDLVAADPDHHGGGRRRAGDALRHHRRPRPRRGLAGPRQHRLRRALRGAGDRHRRDRTGTRRARRAGAVRAAVARADQGDQPRGPQSAPGGRRRGRRPSPGSCSTTGGHGWRPPLGAAASGRSRPRSAPASCASSCRASSARRSWRRPGARRALVVGDPHGRAAAGLRSRCRAHEDGGRRRSPRGCVRAGYEVTHLAGDAVGAGAGGGRALRAGLDHRPHRGARRGRLRALGPDGEPPQGNRHRARRWAVPRPVHPRAAARRARDRVRQLLPSRPHRSGSRGRAAGPDRAAAEPRGQRRGAAGPHGRARRGRRRLGGRRRQCGARFADSFYDGMLGGQAFGRAVLDARRRSTGRAARTRPGAPTNATASRTGGWSSDDAGRGGGGPRLVAPRWPRRWPMAEQIREAAQVGLDRDPRSLRGRLDQLNQARRGQAFETDPRAAARPGRGLWRARLAEEGGPLLRGRPRFGEGRGDPARPGAAPEPEGAPGRQRAGAGHGRRRPGGTCDGHPRRDRAA